MRPGFESRHPRTCESRHVSDTTIMTFNASGADVTTDGPPAPTLFPTTATGAVSGHGAGPGNERDNRSDDQGGRNLVEARVLRGRAGRQRGARDFGVVVPSNGGVKVDLARVRRSAQQQTYWPWRGVAKGGVVTSSGHWGHTTASSIE